MSSLILRIHSGESSGTLGGSVGVIGIGEETPTGVALVDGGLVDRGPWRELAVRLLGQRAIESGDLELVDGTRRWPLFLDQPGRVLGGRTSR